LIALKGVKPISENAQMSRGVGGARADVIKRRKNPFLKNPYHLLRGKLTLFDISKTVVKRGGFCPRGTRHIGAIAAGRN
jgi:hypothetical protein